MALRIKICLDANPNLCRKIESMARDAPTTSSLLGHPCVGLNMNWSFDDMSHVPQRQISLF